VPFSRSSVRPILMRHTCTESTFRRFPRVLESDQTQHLNSGEVTDSG